MPQYILRHSRNAFDKFEDVYPDKRAALQAMQDAIRENPVEGGEWTVAAVESRHRVTVAVSVDPVDEADAAPDPSEAVEGRTE